MKFDPEIHHRRSIRLEGYDYSDEGAYFVTIVTRERECLFSNISDGKVHLNYAGKMIEKWWNELNKKFSMVKTGVSVVMPNHLHGIINIVGAALCGRPEAQGGHPRRGATTLGNIIDWFKTMTTNKYISGVKQKGWSPFSGKLWQRNYYEHIIRNEKELYIVQEYIKYNPNTWDSDEENPALSK